MPNAVQARHPDLNLHSRVLEQAARGKGKAYASVETVNDDDLIRSKELFVS